MSTKTTIATRVARPENWTVDSLKLLASIVPSLLSPPIHVGGFGLPSINIYRTMAAEPVSRHNLYMVGLMNGDP